MKAWILAVTILVATTVSALAAPAALLTPDQIKTTFGTGKPFSAVSESGTKAYVFTFNTDGSALEAVKGKQKGTSGTWRVSDKGYCTAWGKGTEHCYTVEKGQKGYDVRNSVGNLISTWTP